MVASERDRRKPRLNPQRADHPTGDSSKKGTITCKRLPPCPRRDEARCRIARDATAVSAGQLTRLQPRPSCGLPPSCADTQWLWLGINRAHWTGGQLVAGGLSEPEIDVFNSGIAMVTPASEVLAILNDEDYRRERRDAEREPRARQYSAGGEGAT
jgi:hypothetical protein